MTARRVLLWRHGRTAWNVEHRFQGQADPPLDEVGRAQSSAAAALLAAFSPVAIVSSDWSELRLDEHGWRLRAHNVGPAGLVVPAPAGTSTADVPADVEAMDAGPAGALAAVEALDAGPAGAPAR